MILPHQIHFLWNDCTMLSLHLFACPICRSTFTQQNGTLRCTHMHTFDIAREGYVNLLHKQQPGDSAEMLLARRQFLGKGYYLDLAHTLNALLATAMQDMELGRATRILDAGCGEGYYLGQVHDYFHARQRPVECVGLDISKQAVRMAAKRYRDVSFVVANSKERLVFVDHAFDIVLNIFAPRNAPEFARVLWPGGTLLVVIPGPAHLRQVREQFHLLQIEEQKQQHIIEQFAPYFTLQNVMPVRYTLDLAREAITWIVTMTPNFWHLSDEKRQELASGDAISTDVEFLCLLFRKR
jgi:ubiquinone/menaquinone biosynthesis C-methylase UbiE